MGSARVAWTIAVVLTAFVAAAPAAAAGPTPRQRAIEHSLTYRTGTLAVRDARIALPKGYRYLGAHDAQRVLTELYRNPRDTGVLAMILPPRSDAIRNRYVVVVTYDNDGHVSDHDAAGIDYDSMLRSMQKATNKHNATREQQGYPAITLVGWADRPHYDATHHKLYWAKDLSFAGDREDTLNYDVRTFGREGMLSLDAVAAMSDLTAVRTGMQRVLARSRFTGGRRYEDFHHGDRVSKVTVAAVVAGGAYAAAKTGLIALVLAKLKFLAIGVVGVVGALRRRIFRRRRRTVEDW